MVLDSTSCCPDGRYCARADVMFNVPGVHVLAARCSGDELVLTVETDELVGWCPACGTAATGHGRRDRWLHDIPAFGTPVRVRWRKRTWRCHEVACPMGVFSETHDLCGTGVKLTTRAIWWAINAIRRDGASVASLARHLGVDWHTAWDSLRPVLEDLAGDESRFEGVSVLGVDEHVWHHTPRPGKGPKTFTGMVDLTPDEHGNTRARLLDLTLGRSGPVYATWLAERGEAFIDGVQIATLDPFRGYANAIDDQLDDAVAVLDAFHVTRLGLRAMETCRRRVQQEQLGHRGRAPDPLYQVRNALRAGAERLSDKQVERIDAALQAGDPDYEVTIAWQCYQRLRSVFHIKNWRKARKVAEQILDSFHTCPVPEVARLGRTLRKWRDQFLAYFTTEGANNGGTEAMNGIIELHRRIARGFRNPTNYRLRMILAGAGFNHPNLR